MRSQTATVYVFAQVEGDNLASASGVSFVLLLLAFVVTLVVDLVLRKQNNHTQRGPAPEVNHA
jgi:ABC-type sulfate transport system permease component